MSFKTFWFGATCAALVVAGTLFGWPIVIVAGILGVCMAMCLALAQKCQSQGLEVKQNNALSFIKYA